MVIVVGLLSESYQMFMFLVLSNLFLLFFLVVFIVDLSGCLLFEIVVDQVGIVQFQVEFCDDGGMVSGGVDCMMQSLQIYVLLVNDLLIFVLGVVLLVVVGDILVVMFVGFVLVMVGLVDEQVSQMICVYQMWVLIGVVFFQVLFILDVVGMLFFVFLGD